MNYIKLTCVLSCLFLNLNAQENNFTLAKEYFRSGDCEKAITLFKNLEEDDRAIRSYYNNYLSCLLEKEEYKKAENLVRKLQRKNPQHPKYTADLGFVFKAKGLVKKAEKQFHKAINQLEPEKTH